MSKINFVDFETEGIEGKIIEAYACDINQNKIAELSDFDNIYAVSYTHLRAHET